MADIQLHEKVKRITNRIINGLEVKYDPEEQIPKLIELFAEGKDIAAFCSEIEIGRSTFFRWVDEHPEFQRAYEVAREVARIWWENLPTDYAGYVEVNDGAKFNTKLWMTIMKNRFEMTDQRKLTLPKLKNCKSFNEQIQCLANYAADGSLTSGEAQQLSGLILAAVKVDEHTELKSKVEKLEKIAEEQSAGR